MLLDVYIIVGVRFTTVLFSEVLRIHKHFFLQKMHFWLLLLISKWHAHIPSILIGDPIVSVT